MVLGELSFCFQSLHLPLSLLDIALDQNELIYKDKCSENIAGHGHFTHPIALTSYFGYRTRGNSETCNVSF